MEEREISKEEKKLHKRLKEKFEKAIFDYGMIEEGYHVLVALSGGKDSLFLTEMLAERSRIWKPRFNVEALHIRMSHIDYHTSTAYLEQFCKSCDIPLHIIETDFDPTTDKRKVPCFLCSWYRRKALFEHAQRLGCNKLALGHHQDDIIHTSLLNQFFQGRYETMPVKMKMKKMPITLIRPLCLMAESDIKRMATLRQYKKQDKLCPYETSSNRQYVAQLFADIERHNPEARHSMWHAFEKSGILFSHDEET